MWGSADKTMIDQHPLVTDGWVLEDMTYEITWFGGPQLPQSLIPDNQDGSESDHDSGGEDTDLSSSDEDEILSSDEGEFDDE